MPHFCWQPLENTLKGCYTATGQSEESIGKPLGNGRRLLKSLWAILKGYRKAAVKFPDNHCLPIGEEAELPSCYWQKHGNFIAFSLKRYVSVYTYYRLKELWNILITLRCSSPTFALSKKRYHF
jgi:hypothetical protein